MGKFMGEAAGTFFGSGSAGMVMLGLLLGGIVCFAGEKLLITAGKGFFATLFKTGMEIAAILAVLGAAITLLVKIFNVAMGNV